ncbi:MAG: 4Fe-4S dicluster domain-containing protein [bacterium]|nr:4Fe-4S dicluster domain-containing protein [bacterium]
MSHGETRNHGQDHAILVDVTRCTGCETCVAACVAANGKDPRQAERDRATVADGLSADRLSSIVRVGDGRFARKSCMHCLEPSCVSACLVGGLTKTDDGPVVYDPAKCIGCRYCMLACPFHVPRYEWDEAMPLMAKCEMCVDKLHDGQQPACVAACPHQALVHGTRDELLAEAQRRVESDGKYLPHVWGAEEFGGTSVLYVSDVDLATLDWPADTAGPIPHLTDPLIEKTPFMGITVASSLLGLNWVIRRRMKLEREPETGDESRTEGENDG